MANFNPTPFQIRRLIEGTVVTAVIVVVVLLLLWLVFQPRSPTVTITTLTVSGFNLAGSKVSGEWEAQFRVFNPSKQLKVAYGTFDTYIFYKAELLAQTSVQQFWQGTRDASVMEVRYSVVGAGLDKKAASEMAADLARGSVAYDVRVFAWYKAGLVRPRRRSLRVLCKDIQVSVLAGFGNLTGGPRQCKVF